MELVIPLPDGHRWLDRVKERYLADPSYEVVLEHRGLVDEKDVLRMVALAEGHSRERMDPGPVTKRLLNVLVEAMDNLNRHGMKILGDATFALLVRGPEGYRLATGNAVPCAVGAVLSERVSILNMMGPEDLKAHHLKLLSGRAWTAKGGAGLGLLTLARKCASPLTMACDRLGPFTSYFTLEMHVGEQGEGTLGAA